MIDFQGKTPLASSPLKRGSAGVFELGLLAVIAILVFLFLVNPKRAEYAGAKKGLSELQSVHTQLLEDEAKLDALVKSMKSNPKAISELDEALPLNGRFTKLRLALENISKSSGMVVGDITVNAPLGDQIVAGDKSKLANPYGIARKVQKYDCFLTVTGTIDQFQALLQKLENSGRIMDINNISINSTKDNILEFRLNISAYAYE